MTGSLPFPDRDAVADKLVTLSEADKAYIVLLMENAAQDDNLLNGLHRHLDLATTASFVNSLKLDALGFWIGNAAPGRLQIRLMEIAKSSQHPAFAAFRAGLTKSNGLEKTYPQSKL